MTVLQNFIYPSNQTLGSAEKYVRTHGNVYYEHNELEMTKFANAEFDTYYNALSVPLWRDRVGINSIYLEVAGAGEIEIELWHWSNRTIKGFKQAESLTLTPNLTRIFELDISNPFDFSGLLYVKVIAKNDVNLTDMRWVTDETPRREVKLGISVTHFNRKSYVLPAISRIKTQLLDDPIWRDRIDFIVVDNSQNITKEEALGVQIIPNENTGGSGGFTRGFLHYKNDTTATHVLFMDDDASLEIESIKRAYKILMFAEKDNTAVGAALFYEDRPDEFIERGATLSPETTWWAKFRDTDATSVGDIILQEIDEEPNRYFGWWFNAFPIAYTDHLTLPYFVRGDDVSFGVLNNFNMVMGNGIAAIAENFDYKVAPMTEYLDLRNKLIVHSLFVDKPFAVVPYYIRLALNSAMAGRYAYNDVQRMALRDFLNVTPEWLIANANMKNVLPKIREVGSADALHEINVGDYDTVQTSSLAEDKLSTIVRRLTFNRLLFPFDKKKVIVQPFTALPAYRQIAGYKNVLYVNPENGKGFLAVIKRSKFFGNMFRAVFDALHLWTSYRRVGRRLRKDLDKLTSEKMWDDILKLNK
ncbi:MAG: glycosyltransferase [Lactobacillaceae bacterium]|jgi:GT2 family glycosyltransferase|nr:glycosyltransferase [Lactobacillaceae bacterium]